MQRQSPTILTASSPHPTHNRSSPNSSQKKMSSNPDPAATPHSSTTHDPPSLPNSPLPKRTKVIDPTPLSQHSTLPHTDSGTATPTPLAATPTPHPHSHALNSMSLQPSAPIGAAASTAEQQLQVLLLSEHARAPTKGSAFAAGHDLYSARDVLIPKRGRALVPTDISISVPVGTCMSPFAAELPCPKMVLC